MAWTPDAVACSSSTPIGSRSGRSTWTTPPWISPPQTPSWFVSAARSAVHSLVSRGKRDCRVTSDAVLHHVDRENPGAWPGVRLGFPAGRASPRRRGRVTRGRRAE